MTDASISTDLLTIEFFVTSVPCDPGPSFSSRLRREGLRRKALETLQINVGRLCNQACHHCHVDAGPRRTEVMTRETMGRILSFLEASSIPAVDITGGAPEINPNFRYLVRRAREMGRKVTVRCNLTVLFEPGQADLPAFYRGQEVELICSLSCYLQENVDGQRGKGVFVKSIERRSEDSTASATEGRRPACCFTWSITRSGHPYRAPRLIWRRITGRSSENSTASSSIGCSHSPTCPSTGLRTT